MFAFDNTYLKLAPFFYKKDAAEKIEPSKLLMFNHQLAKELGLDGDLTETQILQFFSGNQVLVGSESYAMAYSGHQFGYFNPTMGDGRALVLGEVISQQQERFDIQLKGSGRTSYSRNGDGRSWIGPVVREYLVSEAMYALGIPTTRALCALETKEQVYREDAYPGGIFTRVAKSHLRVGTVEYAAQSVEHLNELVDYAIERHYPELNEQSEKYFQFFKTVSRNFIQLVASWMRIGFIHGVMNTDNTSLCGITIDYGPCAFMDTFKKDKVFSSIDRHGRYRYNNQMQIALWNMSALAGALFELLKKESQLSDDELKEKIQAEFLVMQEYARTSYLNEMVKKFGITDARTEDEALINEFLDYLEREKLDFTNTFRKLSYLETENTSFLEKLKKRWKSEESAQKIMLQNNPYLIPRNHQIQKAIDKVLDGDADYMRFLNQAYAQPYTEIDKYRELTSPPKPEELVYQTFCGT
jgi:uncharacterized protein YdiU (UPF0061 family)